MMRYWSRNIGSTGSYNTIKGMAPSKSALFFGTNLEG